MDGRVPVVISVDLTAVFQRLDQMEAKIDSLVSQGDDRANALLAELQKHTDKLRAALPPTT